MANSGGTGSKLTRNCHGCPRKNAMEQQSSDDPPGTPVLRCPADTPGTLAVPESRAVVAGLQQAGPRGGGGRTLAIARAAEVPLHHLLQPGRVLHDPGLGPARPARAGRGGAEPRRAHPAAAAGADPRGGAGTPQGRDGAAGAAAAPRAGRARHPPPRLEEPGEGRAGAGENLLPRIGVPGAHPAGGGPGPPLSLHLQPLPVAGGRGGRSGVRRAPVREGEGPGDPSALRAPRSHARGAGRGAPR